MSLFAFSRVIQSNIPVADNSLPVMIWLLNFDWSKCILKSTAIIRVERIWFRMISSEMFWFSQKIYSSSTTGSAIVAQIFEIKTGICKWYFKHLIQAFILSILKLITLQSSNTWSISLEWLKTTHLTISKSNPNQYKLFRVFSEIQFTCPETTKKRVHCYGIEFRFCGIVTRSFNEIDIYLSNQSYSSENLQK